MIRSIRILLLASGLTTAAGLASAQAFDAETAYKLRESHMKLMGAHLGVLGKMAKGEAEYDAEVAAASATTLAGLASGAHGNYWVEGSSSDEIADSRALPAIWEKREDFDANSEALIQATSAMRDAAGTDLAALQGAMGGLGGACGDCHKAYRKPEE